MEDLPNSPIALLNRGVAAFHAGNRDDALRLFAQALLTDPESELGWLWFAAATDDPAEKRYALDRAIEINPDSIGGAARKQLLDVAPAMPNELTDIGALPLPPELADLDTRPRGILPFWRLRRERGAVAPPRAAGIGRGFAALGSEWRRWAPVIIAIVVLAALAGRLYQESRPQPERLAIAFAGPLSGPDRQIGLEMANSAQLLIDQVNTGGGIGGQQVELLRYDDESDVDVARVRAEEIAADERVLLVIGHRTSAASLAAGEVYRDAGVPAITPSATADAVTLDNPWYFRTIFTNDFEGALLASYAATVLGYDTASIVTTPAPYESSLATAFASAFAGYGTVNEIWEIDPDQREASIQAVVAALAAEPNPGIVVLTLLQEDARALLLALRRAGLSPPLLGGDALGDEAFAALFANEPEDQDQPGFFTEGLYAAAPLLYDAIGGDALDFAHLYRETYGTSPSWQAAKAYDAAVMALEAITADVEDGATSVADRRAAIRDALAAIDSPDVALRGLTGPLYFDANRTVPQAFSIGRSIGGILTSALQQYRLVSDVDRDDVDADLASGRAIEVAGQVLRLYPVVDVGIDINEIRELDTAAGTFLADFFLWFVAPSNDETLTDVFFPNATKPRWRLERPLDERANPDGTTYRIYRVQRTFVQPLDFHDYPWDQHVLTIVVQNVALQGDDVVYVPSPSILAQSQEERLRSGSNLAEPFNRIDNWEATRVDFVSASTSGRSLREAEGGEAGAFVQFSKFETEIMVQRDVLGFLLRNLMPLALLALVTYLALFFPPDQAEVRIGFAATSILTAAVLLESVSGQLNVGYIVAIEWGYFVYIALSAALIFFNIAVGSLYKDKRHKAVGRLDLCARVLYPVVGLITIMAYIGRYHL